MPGDAEKHLTSSVLSPNVTAVPLNLKTLFHRSKCLLCPGLGNRERLVEE